MKKNGLLFLLLGILFFIVYAYTFDAKLDLNGDNASYIELARNLAHNKGYSSVNVSGFHPSDHFPPGYSAFLSLFVRIGLDNLGLFKVLNGMFMLLSIAGLFFVTCHITKQKYLAFSIAALTVFSTPLLHFSNMVMSEMIYMFFTVVVFVSLYLYDRQNSKAFWQSPWFYAAIVASALSYYTRTIGISIVFAMIIFYVFRKEWLAAASSAGGFVLLYLPWILRNHALGIKSRYFGTVMTVNPWRPEEGSITSVGEFMHKMLINFDDTVLKGFREMLFPFFRYDYSKPSSVMEIIFGLIVLALVFYGAWQLSRMRWAGIAFLVANIGVFLIWHGGNGSRYVTPLTPYLFVMFYLGVFDLAKRFVKIKWAGEHDLKYLFLLIMFFPMLSPVVEAHKIAKMPVPNAYQNYYDIAKFMENKAPVGTVVCCRKPELFNYYAPRMFTTKYAFSLNPDTVIAGLVRDKVDFVVLEQLGYSSTPRYLYPALVKNQDLFGLVWHLDNPDTYLLKFNRDGAIVRLKQASDSIFNPMIQKPIAK